MELTSFAVQYAEAMAQSTGLFVCITDRDQVIAVAGGAKKDLLQKNISRQLEQAINERSTVVAAREDKAFIQLVDEELEESVPRWWRLLSAKAMPLEPWLS